MNPHDFLEVADEWVAGMREAKWRSGVSRAYYAAFHVAQRLLRQCGFVVPKGEQAHAYLWLWLRMSNSGHPDVQMAGADLNYLRRVRNWADYDLGLFFPHALAVGQVGVADNIIQFLELLSTMPGVLIQITETMKDYERDVLGQVTWQP